MLRQHQGQAYETRSRVILKIPAVRSDDQVESCVSETPYTRRTQRVR
jgi:hypothetical protein